MKIKHTLAALSFAAVVTLAGCSGGGEGEDPAAQSGGQPAASDGGGQQQPGGEMPEADVSDVPDVVAEVNDEEISKEDFVAFYEPQFQQQAMAAQQGGQETDQAELKTQVAEQLVDNRLLVQAAEDAGIEATDEDIDAVLEEVAQQNGMGSADEVITALEEQGQAEDDIRTDAATQHLLDTYIAQEADISEPSDEELKKQYEEMKKQAQEQQGAAGGGGQQAEVPPFEEVRDQIADQAVAEQENEVATQKVQELRESADITLHI